MNQVEYLYWVNQLQFFSLTVMKRPPETNISLKLYQAFSKFIIICFENIKFLWGIFFSIPMESEGFMNSLANQRNLQRPITEKILTAINSGNITGISYFLGQLKFG